MINNNRICFFYQGRKKSKITKAAAANVVIITRVLDFIVNYNMYDSI